MPAPKNQFTTRLEPRTTSQTVWFLVPCYLLVLTLCNIQILVCPLYCTRWQFLAQTEEGLLQGVGSQLEWWLGFFCKEPAIPGASREALGSETRGMSFSTVCLDALTNNLSSIAHVSTMMLLTSSIERHMVLPPQALWPSTVLATISNGQMVSVTFNWVGSRHINLLYL